MTQLRLAEMQAQREGAFTLYKAPVADRRKEFRYEVTIHGAQKLVDAVFGECQAILSEPGRPSAVAPIH